MEHALRANAICRCTELARTFALARCGGAGQGVRRHAGAHPRVPILAATLGCTDVGE
jgi:hypothetical protein